MHGFFQAPVDNAIIQAGQGLSSGMVEKPVENGEHMGIQQGNIAAKKICFIE